jgi:hypothetical protein
MFTARCVDVRMLKVARRLVFGTICTHMFSNNVTIVWYLMFCPVYRNDATTAWSKLWGNVTQIAFTGQVATTTVVRTDK